MGDETFELGEGVLRTGYYSSYYGRYRYYDQRMYDSLKITNDPTLPHNATTLFKSYSSPNSSEYTAGPGSYTFEFKSYPKTHKNFENEEARKNDGFKLRWAIDKMSQEVIDGSACYDVIKTHSQGTISATLGASQKNSCYFRILSGR